MDLAELERLGAAERAAAGPCRVRCCTAAGCQSSNALGVLDALKQAAADRGVADRIRVDGVGCLRLCGRGPLVAVDPAGTLYADVRPADAGSIVAAAAGGG